MSTAFDYHYRVQHFSPDPTMLFSGVVACATDVRSLRNSFFRSFDFFFFLFSSCRLI
jgi:hypothetical protein